MRNQRKDKKDRRVIIPKMEVWKKIIYAFTVALFCFMVTKGDPKRSNLLKDIEITDEKLEYIFQTTIAVQTKKIRQRIYDLDDGIWTTITSYIRSSPKWADIQVQLKTRIGIKLNSITYDKAYNNVHIDFGQPCVLDRSYTTKVIQTSDGYFSSWSLRSFQQHKAQFLSELIDNESNNLIDIFKQDTGKMQQLEGEYYSKILTSFNANYHQLDPSILVLKLNQYVLNLVSRAVPENLLPAINSTNFYTKQIANMANPAKDTRKIEDKTKGRHSRERVRAQAKANYKRETQKNIYHYSSKELSQKQKMKKKFLQN